MPQRRKPIKQRPKVEDESTGNPPEKHGPHQPGDEALPGKGGTKAGLNRYAGLGRRGPADEVHRRPPRTTGDTKKNEGKPKGKQKLEMGEVKGIARKKREPW